MMTLTNEQFKSISNENLTEEYWIFQLGVGYVYHNVPKGINFSEPYPEFGKIFWDKIETNVHSLICENGKPKANIEELISGDIRSLAEAVLSILVASYDITLAIGIPITALVLKKGILKFCSKSLNNEPDPKLIKSILENKSLKIKTGKKNKKASH